MPYQPTKPAPNDLLSNSVNDIQQNFLIANTTMAINHFPFDNVTANVGKHKFVAIPIAAAPAGVAGDGNIYANTAISASPSTESNMFYTPDASGLAYQITRTITARFSQFAVNAALVPPVTDQVGGWTFLPGGLLYEYGQYRLLTDNNLAAGGTITFPVPFTSLPHNIQITPTGNSNSGQTIMVVNRTNTNFTWHFSANGSSTSYGGFYWTAIGK